MAVPLTLKVFKNETLVSSKDFDRDIIKIGRLSSAHLCLEDEKVSRIHSVIEAAADGSLSIIDMGSVEGTYVNGKRVNKGRIAFGDEIRVGGTTIRLENPAAMAAVNLAAAVSGTEATVAVPVAPAPIAEAPLASSLAQAVVAPVAPEPVQAMDSSFLATQKHETVQPVVAEPAAPVERVRTVRRGKSNGPLGVSLRFMWGDQRVGEFLLAPGKKTSFTVGSAAGVNFVMGDTKLEQPRMELLRTDGQSFTLLFTGKMKGELVRKDETLDLKAVIESGKASNDGGAYGLTLESDDFCWVDLGGITVEVCFQAVPKKVHVPFADSVDYRTLNVFLLTFFAGTMFVISAANRSGDGEAFADELAGNNARLAKLIIKPPETQKNKFLEKLNEQKAEKEKKKSGEIKQKKDENQVSKKDEVKTNRTPVKDKRDEARALTQKIFGGKGGAAAIFGSAGLGGDLKSAMGNMFGAKTGASGGFGGLGIRGGGGGGGGTGDTVGIGGIGTKGRGGGTASYGSGVGTLGGKQSVDVGITSSEPMVMGSLDKELIRQVIQRNRSQIRFCYESQLTKYPKLGGKVAVKFVINAEGRVVSSDVAQSTAGNAELESCVAGRVRTWQFPKPKGGGVVIVTYPFIFKQSGE
ncbi:adventurous gliding motility protein GltG [Stigmatella sp. ncwal1]|uniref:Adventurous gliding motility protein GltG n=1 Tax=Stigmatella ashevillensis TaxID=2995309 RepID=A0ABT5D856_9BACT|nr:adventurous gliding motility protein GltG [Stigmatella ashevillena]MDC0709023.1 adventurous gliding motility protein GltG [Stigmatella ashevillena]